MQEWPTKDPKECSLKTVENTIHLQFEELTRKMLTVIPLLPPHQAQIAIKITIRL